MQVIATSPLLTPKPRRRAVPARLWPYVLVSTAIIVPCFWHAHVEAADLGSHVYNAWLYTQIEGGNLSGLKVAPQYTNVLTDTAFSSFGKMLGFDAAEKIIVPICVLVFFWGTFTFISRIAGRHAWPLVPLIAILAYGYSFERGFLNYYVSLGLAFAALALIWRARGIGNWIGSALIGVLAAVAHPFGVALLAAFGAYSTIARRLPPGRWLRRAMFGSGVLLIAAANFRLRHITHRGWETRRFYLFNGSDQFWLFGPQYLAVAIAITFLSAFYLGWWFWKERSPEREQADFRIVAELWVLFVLWAAVIPEMVVTNLYPAVIGPLVSRTTSVTAVLALAVLAYAKPKLWYTGLSTALAIIFFVFLYQDTSTLARMENNASILVGSLPANTRIIQTIGSAPDSRIPHIGHLTERSFIGHALSYSNYEPPTQQFRIRIQPSCRISARTADAAWAMEVGTYRPRPDELPLKQLYQCSATDPARLCLRDLKAGEPNCPHCSSALNSRYP